MTQFTFLTSFLRSGDHPLPEGWTSQRTPEGDTYYWHPEIRVVTPADITAPEIRSLIWQGYDKLKGPGSGVESTSVELYLDVALQGQGSIVDYYFVDKDNKHPFWTESVGTGDLGIPAYETEGFLSECPI